MMIMDFLYGIRGWREIIMSLLVAVLFIKKTRLWAWKIWPAAGSFLRQKSERGWAMTRERLKKIKLPVKSPIPRRWLEVIVSIFLIMLVPVWMIGLLIIKLSSLLTTGGGEKTMWLAVVVTIVATTFFLRWFYKYYQRSISPAQPPDTGKDKKGEVTAKEKGKGPSLVLCLIAAVVIVSIATNWAKIGTCWNPAQQVKKPTTWGYVLETPPGSPGINQGQALVKGRATLIEDSKEVLAFRVYYDDLDKTRTCDLYLDRNKKDGVWNQRKPASEGCLQLTEMQTIPGGYCLRVNRSDSTNVWANVFLTPTPSN